jgi:alkylated DNA repair protein (DNA oxidative demethylase)
MNASHSAMQRDLLSGLSVPDVQKIAKGAALLHGFAASEAAALMQAIDEVIAAAPLRHMITPGGYRMSVAMTNCGDTGWYSERSGYRYDPRDPATGKSWPAMPDIFIDVARRAAAAGGYSRFEPDACLINRYEPGARLTLHQDKNERDYSAPIVSVSLGLPAVFLFGGLRRKDRPLRMRLESGDIVVWGGPTRLAYHGVAALADGNDSLTGRCRYNLTFRKAL